MKSHPAECFANVSGHKRFCELVEDPDSPYRPLVWTKSTDDPCPFAAEPIQPVAFVAPPEPEPVPINQPLIRTVVIPWKFLNEEQRVKYPASCQVCGARVRIPYDDLTSGQRNWAIRNGQ